MKEEQKKGSVGEQEREDIPLKIELLGT